MSRTHLANAPQSVILGPRNKSSDHHIHPLPKNPFRGPPSDFSQFRVDDPAVTPLSPEYGVDAEHDQSGDELAVGARFPSLGDERTGRTGLERLDEGLDLGVLVLVVRPSTLRLGDIHLSDLFPLGVHARGFPTGLVRPRGRGKDGPIDQGFITGVIAGRSDEGGEEKNVPQEGEQGGDPRGRETRSSESGVDLRHGSRGRSGFVFIAAGLDVVAAVLDVPRESDEFHGGHHLHRSDLHHRVWDVGERSIGVAVVTF